MSKNFATYYRPKTFSDVVGQDVAKNVLRKIAMADGIAVRAIFLKGGFGCGKSTLARIFGRAMNCENFKKTGEVCNECNACKEALARNSQLYMELDASVVGNVEQIRNLQEQFSYTPNGRRVVVFDEIHAASKAALNAMLKMIEDGVKDTIFVFCSTEDILPTIKSRSLCLDISTIPHDLIKSRVKQVAEERNIKVSNNALDTIAIKSNGHMRDALSLLQLYDLCGEEGLKSSYGLMESFMKKVLSNKRAEAEEILSKLLTYNTVDVKNSIYIFIKNVYTSTPESSLNKILVTGLINKVFNYFFSPVNQMALKDEMGLELVLRNFIEKVCNGRTV